MGKKRTTRGLVADSLALAKADIKSDFQDLQIACNNFREVLGGSAAIESLYLASNKFHKKIELIRTLQRVYASMEGPEDCETDSEVS